MRGALLFLKHSLLPTSYKPTRKNASQGPHGGSFEPFTLFQISRYGWRYRHSGGGMADHLRSSFAIIRFNSRTYESGGVMAVLQAHTAAENLMRGYDPVVLAGSRSLRFFRNTMIGFPQRMQNE